MKYKLVRQGHKWQLIKSSLSDGELKYAACVMSSRTSGACRPADGAVSIFGEKNRSETLNTFDRMFRGVR